MLNTKVFVASTLPRKPIISRIQKFHFVQHDEKEVRRSIETNLLRGKHRKLYRECHRPQGAGLYCICIRESARRRPSMHHCCMGSTYEVELRLTCGYIDACCRIRCRGGCTFVTKQSRTPSAHSKYINKSLT
jgi:hypothetical protein